MKTRNSFYTLLWVSLFVLATQSLFGAPPYKYRFYVKGTDGFYRDSVLIGLNSTATYGYENVVWGPGDTVKEVESPIAPLGGVFNFRDVDLPGQKRLEGAGCNMDIRLATSSQIKRDTIVLQFQSSDSTGSTAVNMSWPSDLLTYGAGGFRMEDSSVQAAHGHPNFDPIDMTKQSSFMYPIKNAGANQYVRIIIGDGYRYRTFSEDSIDYAHDSKGKPAPEKLAGSGSEWTIGFPNKNGAPGQGIWIEFGQKITSFTNLGGCTIDFPPLSPPSSKFHLMANRTVGTSDSIVISGTGDKGKIMSAKAAYTNAVTGPSYVLIGDKKKNPGNLHTNRITLKSPNIINILNELFLQGFFPINVGLGAAAPFKAITHKKYGDVLKTLIKAKAPIVTQTGPARCFTGADANGTDGAFKWKKTLTKPYGAVGPDKYNNKLIGELLTLKINVLASQTRKIPHSLDQLVMNNKYLPFSVFNGQNIAQIIVKVDTYLSNCDSGLKAGAYTGADLALILHTINTEFSAKFDTIGWGKDAGTKLLPSGKTVGFTELGGVKSVLMDTLLTEAVAPTPSTEPLILGKNYNRELGLPEKFAVNQNYPNPFNPSTTIKFNLPQDAFVTVKVFNILGQEVATLANHEQFNEGSNEIEFNAANFASGVYFYHVIVNDGQFQEVKKMVLMK